MKRWCKWVAGIALAGAALLQLTNPPHTNPPVLPGHDLLASDAPPPAVASLLKNACYNCHSYETEWPWYSYIAPVSWRVFRHVSDARDAMNFSDWPHEDARRVRKRWRHIADAVEDKDMPYPNYSIMHAGARLTDAQRAEFVKWVRDKYD